MSLYQDVARFNGPNGTPGLDHSGSVITGPRVVAERVAARWLRAPGACWWSNALEEACGLGKWLNHDYAPSELPGLRAKLLRAAEAEDGVVRASVTLTETDRGIAVAGSLVTTEGAVELNVDAAGAVAILTPKAAT